MLKLLDKNIFVLPGNQHMLVLGKIGKSLREFWVMLCIAGPKKGQCYIEEWVPNTVDFNNDVFGNFKFIEDDDEAEELARFAEKHKLTDLRERTGEMVESGLGQVVFG